MSDPTRAGIVELGLDTLGDLLALPGDVEIAGCIWDAGRQLLQVVLRGERFDPVAFGAEAPIVGNYRYILRASEHDLDEGREVIIPEIAWFEEGVITP